MINAIMEYVRPLYLSKPTTITPPPRMVPRKRYGLPDDKDYYCGYPNECYEPLQPPPIQDEGRQADFKAALALHRGRQLPDGHVFGRRFRSWEELQDAGETDGYIADLVYRVICEEDKRWERRIKAHERLTRLPGTVNTALRHFAAYKIAAGKNKAAPMMKTPRYAGVQLRTVDESGMHLSPYHIELVPREKIAYIQATGKDDHLNSTGLSELYDIVNWTDQEFLNKNSYMMRMGSFQIMSYPALRLWEPTADSCHKLIQRPGARKPEAEEGGDGSNKGGVSAPKPGGGSAPF